LATLAAIRRASSRAFLFNLIARLAGQINSERSPWLVWLGRKQCVGYFPDQQLPAGLHRTPVSSGWVLISIFEFCVYQTSQSLALNRQQLLA
jgi:hypothetical protein